MLVLFVAPPAGKEKSRPETPPEAESGRVADFSLKERSGSTVARDDLLGKVWIASFVVTRCPDGKCPSVMQTMQRLQKELAGRPDLRLVTFTVDPRDDPDELKRYAKLWDADSERWLFLTGDEKEIDRLLRSFYLRGPKNKPGETSHAQKLVVVDRHGKVRGYYDGMKDLAYPDLDEEFFEQGLRKLKRQVDELLLPDLPAWMPGDFPAFNATLNGLAALLIFTGWVAIRQRLVRLHILCMLSALLVSAVFLASYLFYHLAIKGGQPTRFSEQAPEAPVWVAYLYHGILISHTLLAVVATPLALVSAYLGLRNRLARHVRLARWTLPIWLYVSVTGVVVYWMLYRLY
jgi:uncharacterized membrane protein YozB (DUF420 family)/cytochrome oxidase Cu insertion factor (SCO1/SenC/PrrC family)